MTREEFIKTNGKDYSGWFGNENTLKDMLSVEDFNKKECIEVIENGYMILCIFDDRFIAFGNECCHNFCFKKQF